MTAVPSVVDSLSARLTELGWVSDLLVAGSLALGDYVGGVSDVDLVAITDGAVDRGREPALANVHRDLDRDSSGRVDLGCAYVAASSLPDPSARHPTWTHQTLIHRPLSLITRAELVRHGFAVFGRAPESLLPAVSDEDVRAAAKAELCGYWAWAAQRPWIWLDPVIADLALTSMARARYTTRTGRLLTKTAAVDHVHAPHWLKDQLRARRSGQPQPSPRIRTAWIAWRDARATIRELCGSSTAS